MKKIGLLCLALVLALGTLGVGYASWTDTVVIDGSVSTGDVDIEIDSVSSTYVFKILSTGGIAFQSYPMTISNDYVRIASAVTTSSGQTVTMTFTNLFPTETQEIKADVVMHYVGSIPAHVALTNVVYTPVTGVDLTTYMVQEWSVSYDGGTTYTVVEPETVQLHDCDYVKLWLWFDLDQDNTLMNASGTLSADIVATQWNK